MSKTYFLDAPSVGSVEKEYLCQAIDGGFVSTFGPYVDQFEDEMSRYLGVSKSVSVQSGTAAIHMALHELGIGVGDEVIVPSLTFIASVNPIVYVGATPVFADVDINTWTLDLIHLEKKITAKTKAIILVHLYGNPCNMAEILKFAKKHNLFVIEDATESLGSKYDGKPTGCFGDFGCFSFNGNKMMTTGGGGLIISKSESRLKHIKFLVNQAKEGLFHTEIGFNYRMTNIEASLGLAQLTRLNLFLETRDEFFEIYTKKLMFNKKIAFQKTFEGASSSKWLIAIKLSPDVQLSVLQKKLASFGIQSRRNFEPVSNFPPYQKYQCADVVNAQSIYEHSLCLPSSTLNSNDDIKFVAETLDDLV
jgi:perosamine synthetase